MDKTADGIAAPATDGDAADPESGMTTLPVWFDPEKGPPAGLLHPIRSDHGCSDGASALAARGF